MQPNRNYESLFVFVDNLSIDKLIIDSSLLHESTVGSDTDNTDADDQQHSLSDNEQPTTKSTPVIDGNKESSITLSNLRDWFATTLEIKQQISNV